MTEHKLTQVTSHPNGGWSGTCSCLSWGHAGAPTKQKLKAEHQRHIRAAASRR